MTTRHAVPALLLLLLLSAVAWGQEKAPQAEPKAEKPKAENPKARFYEARRVMLAGDPKSAAELFKTVEAEDRKSKVADDCLYWMGRCYLRVPDKEPDAVVAFLRLIREHSSSPFVDDAARELAVLGDRTILPELEKRVAAGGAAGELARRALEEFGVQQKPASKAPEEKSAKKSDEDEIRRLREQIERLKKEVEEALAMVKKLLAEKEKAAAGESPAKGG
ncbi:MAG: tetratricopeptide repeat protein, partial [Planctomycetota bacterium]